MDIAFGSLSFLELSLTDTTKANFLAPPSVYELLKMQPITSITHIRFIIL